jgi:hypothetical protein
MSLEQVKGLRWPHQTLELPLVGLIPRTLGVMTIERQE